MLWVVTGGREFRRRAKTRRFSRILSSSERRSEASGTSVPCSLEDQQSNPIVGSDQRSTQPRRCESIALPGIPSSLLKQPLTDPVLDLGDSIPQLLRDGLTLESFDGVRVRRGGHDDECHHRRFGPRLLESEVETCDDGSGRVLRSHYFVMQVGWENGRLTGHALDEHIHSLVPVLVPSGGEEVKGVVEVEIVMAVEMTPDEVIDLVLGHCVEVLELVHGREFNDVQTVGKYAVLEALK